PLAGRPLGGARMYAAPTPPAVGEAVPGGSLARKLDRPGDRVVADPTHALAPGEYRAAGPTIELAERPSPAPWAAAPRRVRVGLEGGRVAAIEDLEGGALDRFELEPEMLAVLGGGGATLGASPELAPPACRSAVLAAEDRHFFLHPGVDPVAIARALVADLRAGRAHAPQPRARADGAGRAARQGGRGRGHGHPAQAGAAQGAPGGRALRGVGGGAPAAAAPAARGRRGARAPRLHVDRRGRAARGGAGDAARARRARARAAAARAAAGGAGGARPAHRPRARPGGRPRLRLEPARSGGALAPPAGLGLQALRVRGRARPRAPGRGPAAHRRLAGRGHAALGARRRARVAARPLRRYLRGPPYAR